VHHGRHQSFPRNPSSHHTPLSHQMAGAFNECFSSGRASASHVPTTMIKNDNDQQMASSENAVRHASDAAGLGPVQNSAAPGPGSSIDRQAGYYPGAWSSNPNAPMGNSAPPAHNHNHIRIPQFENATTQSTPGHDRTGIGGGRNNNIDAGDMHAGSGGLPLPLSAEHHPTAQPICKQGGIRYAVEMTRAYDTSSSLGLTAVVGLC
jgi:hypothetical protein